MAVLVEAMMWSSREIDEGGLPLCRVEVRKLEESDRASCLWLSAHRADSSSTTNQLRDDQSRS
jgi:hypothetical protein